jgi:hypothetical protein
MLLMEDEAMEEFDGLDTQKPNAIVVGLAPSKFNYEKVIAIYMQKKRKRKKNLSIYLLRDMFYNS